MVTVKRLKPSLKKCLSKDECWNLKRKQGLLATGVDVKLLTSDGRTLLHDGVSVGEICLHGPWISTSYYAMPGHEVTVQQIHPHLSTAFAQWQLPDNVLCVEALPKTSVGKLNKEVIRIPYADPYTQASSAGGEGRCCGYHRVLNARNRCAMGTNGVYIAHVT